MTEEIKDQFPISTSRQIQGTRKLAREKVLQILMAYEVSGTELDVLYQHIFPRDYNFEEDNVEIGKLLRPEEIHEIEADTKILWKPDDVEFVKNLLNYCSETKTYINEMITNAVENWELDRLALIDRLLILIATTEFLRCQDIPTKVSINEAIDIAKKYSTDKSHLFINGILDSFLIKLKSENLIKKIGKGLIEK